MESGLEKPLNGLVCKEVKRIDPELQKQEESELFGAILQVIKSSKNVTDQHYKNFHVFYIGTKVH